MATDLRKVAQGMVRAAKARATKAGVPFALATDDITIPFACPVLDIPIIVGSGKPTDNSPSLDRVVPALGYVRGNVLVISNRANRIKNNATVPELRMVADFFENHMTQDWMKP